MVYYPSVLLGLLIPHEEVCQERRNFYTTTATTITFPIEFMIIKIRLTIIEIVYICVHSAS